jgi:hypothetical protein
MIAHPEYNGDMGIILIYPNDLFVLQCFYNPIEFLSIFEASVQGQANQCLPEIYRLWKHL